MRARTRLAQGLAVIAAASFVLVAGGPTASGDTAPPPGTPATVSADALPTWQVNGVVWSQVVVGKTVYVAGSFTRARPPGVGAGGSGEVTANNAFAYDITTGNRVTSFAPSFDAQSNVVAASPDGTRVYFGGDFTKVDGAARSHVVAFDTATNKVATGFRASVSSRVTAITVSPTAVYVGGRFGSVNGVSRPYLAALRPSDGTSLPWRPVADSTVTAMVLAPDGSRVIVGGRFTTLNGISAPGMGAVDATTGASTLQWDANKVIVNYGPGASITTLRTDGRLIYGAGYKYMTTTANFEGTFGADPSTGALVFVNDCHGDTYDVLPVNGVLYASAHTHSCQWTGAFKNNTPGLISRWTTAYSTTPSCTNYGPDDYGWNFNGLPCTASLAWYPLLNAGTYTGQGQASWSVAGNASYVVYGGEFTSVNGKAQQGLVRFAIRSLAPNKQGPLSSAYLTPLAASVEAGTVHVTWQATYDRDNSTLTYKLLRDGGTTPIATLTADSNFWTLPALSYRDTPAAGSTHTYRVVVSDTFGNSLTSASSQPVTVRSTSSSLLAHDTFSRSVGGFGKGEAGGTWSTNGSNAGFQTAYGYGVESLFGAGSVANAYLPSVSTTTSDITVTAAAEKVPVGNAIEASVVARRVSSSTDYRAVVAVSPAGAVTVTLASTVSGTRRALSPEVPVPGVVYTAAMPLRVRVQALGTSSTTLRVKVWPLGSAEPSSWTAEVSDATSGLQQAGSVGLSGYLRSGVTNASMGVRWDDLRVTTG